ncbi:condensation domain-containing protein [Streptomyces sulphureus]|uniref:condensation domain-containing protein n=1 Tax=Streptomyces sulphureus TaxID=47758 RepID=UPI0003A64340|nr:condensation domain-containing protein [Streptomyces sulphureus]
MSTHDVEDVYILSPMQEGLLFYTLQNPSSSMYVQQLAHTYIGDLDVDALRSAWQTVVGRHPVLRSAFAWERLDKPLQMVHREAPVDFEMLDWRGLPADELAAREERLLQGDREQGFVLSRPPLMRFYLARLDGGRHRFVVSVHHLVLDGWATGVVLKEVAAAYTALCAGKPVDLPTVRPFRTYIDWLREKDPETAETYWRRQLKGVRGPTPLLPDAEPGSGTGAQHVAKLELDEADSALLSGALRERRLTLSTLTQAAWALLLSRYAGTPEAVFGTVSSGRPPELDGSDEMVGLFVNTLPTRIPVDPTTRVGEWLDEVQRRAVAAREHEHVPLTRIQEWSDVPQGTEMFETVQVVQNSLDTSLLWDRFADLEVADPVYFTRTSFPLTLAVVPGDRILLRAMYDRSWLPDTMAERLLGHMRTLLTELARNPDRRLGDLPMLTPDELTGLLAADAETSGHRARPPLEACHAHAGDRPERTAVTHGTASLTWKDLDSRAGKLATLLRERGVDRNCVVAVCHPDPVATLTGLLAVWRAGGAPAPLDSGRPAAELAALVDAAGAELVLSDAGTGAAFEDADHEVLRLDRDDEAIASLPEHPHSPATEDAALAYVAFTSGAEDGPKAVSLDQRALAATADVRWDGAAPGADDTFLLQAPPDSYLYLFSLVTALHAGARIVLPTEPVAGDSSAAADAVAAAVAEHEVTGAVLTPALLGCLDPEGPAGRLRTVVVTGERCAAAALAGWARDAERRVLSLYGSAETAGAAVLGRAGTDGTVTGRPAGGRRAYVLGASGTPVPRGVAGELHVAGPGLSPGYLDRPALTVECFRPDPFVAGDPQRMYRTGDLARWTESGDLEILGRVSERLTAGSRAAHPAAVAELLGSHPAVSACAVGSHDGTLTAYVVPDHEGAAAAERHEQVDQWRRLYEHTYADRADTGDAEFNIVGWNSSYTGAAIPEEEMREWRDATLAQLSALRPAKVLEIGCGTGMFLLPLSRTCAEYWGTDLSSAALDYVREQLTEAPYQGARVTLQKQQAEDFTGIPEGRFDLVVLNSVSQYFPDEDYLRRVLDGAVRALRPGGRIFVGDVRNLDTLDALHLELRLEEGTSDASARELWLAARSRARLEEELVLAPDFFRSYAAGRQPGAVARVCAKWGRARNELTRHRYDVLIDLAPAEPAGPDRTCEWARDAAAPGALDSLLAADVDSVLVRGVPDARVRDQTAAVAALRRGATRATAEDLAAWLARGSGVDPEDLRASAERAGFQADLLLGAEAGTLDVLFVRTDSPAAGDRRAALWRHHAAAAATSPRGRHANVPLTQRQDARLLAALQTLAEHRLPPHVCPSEHQVLADLPLTRDGRVDHRGLRSLCGTDGNTARDLVAPRDGTELIIARVWEEVLGVRPVGVHDNFFSLGGHSLVAMRVISRLQRRFNRDIDLASLLNRPTVAELADVLREDTEGPTRSPVVTLQPEGDRTPLFLVHPSGSNLLVYQFLAERLAPDTPVHMLESPALRRFGSVEELAAHYAEAIRATVPHGPYRLGGLSFGGLVSFEVARQLAEAGEHVETLTMFESSLAGPVPTDLSEEDLLAYRTVHFTHVFELIFNKRVPLTEDELRGLGADEQLDLLYQRIDETFQGEVGTGLLRRTVEDVQHVRELIRTYRPGPYSGPVHLFIGLEPMPPHLNDPEFYRSDRALGWDAYLPDLRLVDTPGNHLTLLNPPHVDTLAQWMRDVARPHDQETPR